MRECSPCSSVAGQLLGEPSAFRTICRYPPAPVMPGLLLFLNRFVPLALRLLAPNVVNIGRFTDDMEGGKGC